MSPRSPHHLPSTPIGGRDVDLVVRKPFAVMVLVAFLSVAAVVLGTLAVMVTHSPWEDTTTSGVVLDGGVDGVPDHRAYPRTETVVGRLVSIADVSVSMQRSDGAVLDFAITPETIVVPPYGMDGRPIEEQFVPNQPVVVIGHVIDGVATATAVVDPGPDRRRQSPVPLVLA
jgi:hypothetical protein